MRIKYKILGYRNNLNTTWDFLLSTKNLYPNINLSTSIKLDLTLKNVSTIMKQSA